MEYTVQKLAKLAGISPRTIRFYDEIGLLKPARVSASGYRIYGGQEVDVLQQILFYREMGLELSAIGQVIKAPAFDRMAALKAHLAALEDQKARVDRLIHTVRQTIESEEGGKKMKDKEKFEGFKRELIQENERKYGEEIREKYGADTVARSNAKMMNMTKEAYDTMQALSAQVLEKLRDAVKAGLAPHGDTGKEIALLHKQWLTFTWPEYKKEAHLGLAQMYLDDARFTAYYDKEVPGCAQFLRDAVHAWEKAL